jgi:uncharacterized protein YbjT (DUF2867 family)
MIFIRERLLEPPRSGETMKVLVLGATGGTGKQIVTEARRQGHSVVVLVRSKERAQRA